MKWSHHPDTLHPSLSGLAISPVMSGELESQTKWSDAGEVEPLMNNLKGIQCSLKDFSLSVHQPHSVTLSVYSIVDRRGEKRFYHFKLRFLVEALWHHRESDDDSLFLLAALLAGSSSTR